MKNIIISLISLSIFAVLIYALCYVFNISNVIFSIKNVNGQEYITFNFYNYVNNFNNSFSSFQETISKLTENHYNWDDIIKAVKSIANILITVVNSLLLPFSIVGSLLNVVCAFIGLPLNNTNPLYALFNGLASLQIPYIPLD